LFVFGYVLRLFPAVGGECALDLLQRYNITAIHAFTAPGFILPGGAAADQLWPPWIGAALARASGIDPAAAISAEKRTATITPQADAGLIRIFMRQITLVEPGWRNTQCLPDFFCFAGR